MVRKFCITLLLMLIYLPSALMGETRFIIASEYLPHLEYQTETETTTSSLLRWADPADTLQPLLEPGYVLPAEWTTKRTSGSYCITGGRQGSGDVPLRLTLDRIREVQIRAGVESNTSPVDILGGSTFRGLYAVNGDPEMVEINGQRMEETFRREVNSELESRLFHIRYPREPLTVGDSFSLEVPMSLSIPGVMTIDTIVTNRWTLMSVDDSCAFFEINVKEEIDLFRNSVDVSLRIEESGTCIHDADKSAVVLMETSTNIVAAIQLPESPLILESSRTKRYSCTITRRADFERVRVVLSDDKRVEVRNAFFAGDSLKATDPNGDVFTIDRGRIRTLHRYMGTEATNGCLIGAALGGAIVAVGYIDSRTHGDVDDGVVIPATIACAVVGGLVGRAIGDKIDKWECVPLQPVVPPDLSGGAGISLTLRF